MRVLGVDPGLTRCGLGVVDGVAGRPLTMVGVGVVRTPADAAIPERLRPRSSAGIEEWLDEHRPDAVAVERVFSQHNVRTVMGTAQASAVAMLVRGAARAARRAAHPERGQGGRHRHGRADKAQVGAMVTRLCGSTRRPKPADAADALALAICHIWRGARAAQPAPAGRVARPRRPDRRLTDAADAAPQKGTAR